MKKPGSVILSDGSASKFRAPCGAEYGGFRIGGFELFAGYTDTSKPEKET